MKKSKVDGLLLAVVPVVQGTSESSLGARPTQEKNAVSLGFS